MDSTRSIARWVRLSGEPDELASFEWVKARLEEYGFETELTHHRAYISLPGPAVLRVAGHDREVTGISHAFATSTPTGGLSGRLVDARSADAAGAADAFAGKIVLVDGMASGVSVRTWEDRGTIAQVHVHDDHLHETSVSPVWGNPTEQGLELMPRTPGLAIRRSDAAWLRELMSGGPIEVTIHTEVLTEWRPIPLLTAALPTAPAEPYVLLSSHIDSWYYGAMDNGSANATTLEVARILAENAGELRRGLRVAFWSGHSHGRFAGSAWYADDRWLDLHEHCVAHVFVDSTGGKGATVVTEAPVMPQTKGLAAAAVKAVTGEEFDGKRIGRFADQSFYAIGLNSVFGTLSEQEASGASDTISFKTGGKRAGGLGWWWHTPDDTVDKVDEAFLVRDTKIYLAALHRLLTAPRLPFDYRPAIEEIAPPWAPGRRPPPGTWTRPGCSGTPPTLTRRSTASTRRSTAPAGRRTRSRTARCSGCRGTSSRWPSTRAGGSSVTWPSPWSRCRRCVTSSAWRVCRRTTPLPTRWPRGCTGPSTASGSGCATRRGSRGRRNRS